MDAEQKPLGGIKPDINKLFFLDFGKVALAAGLIIGTGYYINSILDVSNIAGTVLETFSLSPTQDMHLGFWLTIGIIGVTALILALDYLNLGNMNYVFYPAKAHITKSFLFIRTKNLLIPYDNITRVTQAAGPLGTGKIRLELSGMKDPVVFLDFVDKPEQAIANINYVIEQYRNQKYYQMMQDTRLDRTLTAMM